MRVVDPNMDIVLLWADELGSPPTLPLSLQDVEQRARLIDKINDPLIHGSLLNRLSDAEKSQRLNDVASLSKNYIPDVDDGNVRVNITLRLWSGCLSAAKTIALQTMGGSNTPEMRASIFSNRIDPVAQCDPIYRAGVETAPSFKRLRNEPYSFEGVPKESVALMNNLNSLAKNNTNYEEGKR